jgi:diguanylate cyclase (GGDEF)-like protein
MPGGAATRPVGMTGLPRTSSISALSAVRPLDRLLRPTVRIDPTAPDLALMRVVAILQYLVGGLTLVLAALVLPGQDEFGQRAYVVLGGVAVVLAAVRFFRPVGSLFQARASNIAGLAFITVIVAISRPVGATPAFYLWPILTAAYFLRRRDLVVVLGLFTVEFAAALWWNGEQEGRAQIYVPMILVVFVVTGLVRLLRESLAEVIGGLERTASTDHLTGLANRATLEQVVGREIQRARRTGGHLCVVALDLDHFKAVNDRHGHAGGDHALRRCADVLASECRGVDLPARVGGEEFVVALPDTTLEDARRFAERVRVRIETATASDAAPLTVSCGVAALDDSHHLPGHLVALADGALYEAKRAGRNRVEVGRPRDAA